MKLVKICIGCFLFYILYLNINLTNPKIQDNFTLDQIFCTANAELEEEICVSHPDAFCKNRPGDNEGVCVHEYYQMCCKPTTSQNLDCYDVGI